MEVPLIVISNDAITKEKSADPPLSPTPTPCNSPISSPKQN